MRDDPCLLTLGVLSPNKKTEHMTADMDRSAVIIHMQNDVNFVYVRMVQERTTARCASSLRDI